MYCFIFLFKACRSPFVKLLSLKHLILVFGLVSFRKIKRFVVEFIHEWKNLMYIIYILILMRILTTISLNPMILQNINNRIRTPNSIDYFNEDLNLTFIN